MLNKTRFRIGLNGQPGNIETILSEFGKEIYEVYAPCPPNICATARRVQVPLSEKEIIRQIKLAHKYNVRYNMLMNASCHGGKQFSKDFRDKILKFIDLISRAGADSVTVVDPYLLRLIRAHSDIRITVGQWAHVAEPVKALRFKTLGANSIILHTDVNRNFEMLKLLKKEVDLELQIFVNTGELYQCENFTAHCNFVSHMSILPDEGIKSLGNYNYCLEKCRIIKQTNPVEFLMCAFIRPEDLHLYERMGYRTFKIAGRKSSTSWMVRTVRAYLNRSYDGNVLDLCSHYYHFSDEDSPKLLNLPNKALDGWFEFTGGYEREDLRQRCKDFYKIKGLSRFFDVAKRKVAKITTV